jgi:cytochrome c556
LESLNMARSRNALLPLTFVSVMLLSGGCGAGKKGAQPGVPVGPGDAESPSKIKQIMMKVGRGPQALNGAIGRGLDAEQPAWDTLQPQAKEYAQLASDLGLNDPPKGSKESWKQYTSSYAESAAALERAAQAKDQSAAKAAHAKLTESCKGCHQEHRGMGPRGGG